MLRNHTIEPGPTTVGNTSMARVYARRIRPEWPSWHIPAVQVLARLRVDIRRTTYCGSGCARAYGQRMSAKDIRRLMRRELDAATRRIAEREERRALWTLRLLLSRGWSPD